MSLQRSWRQDPPPLHAPHPADVHTPFLVSLTNAISDLSHSNGRIEATLEHMGNRLEDGDSQFQQIRGGIGAIQTEIAEVRGEVAALKAIKHEPRPSRLVALRGLIETSAPLLREAWPFLAVAGAASAKALGYDLSAVFGP